MTERTDLRTGGRILVDALKIHGVDHAFCVPGESFIAVLDALYDARDDIRLITTRHESGAAFMAEAHGKLTGRPGVCLVSRGPGACNASIGIHAAAQDSSPLVMFVGLISRDRTEREAFQEVDIQALFGQGVAAKWAATINSAARIPEMVNHAFHAAVAGRPGPVVLGLPEDMLDERVAVADVGPYAVVRPHPGADQLTELRRLLVRASRPLMIIGGGGWTAAAAKDIVAFAEANDLPTANTVRCQDLFDNEHRCYVGDIGMEVNPALAERVRQSDLLIVVGARLGDMTTQGYTLLRPPKAPQTLVHVYADPNELGRVYHADLPIASGMAAFAAAARALDPVESPATWASWTVQAREDFLARLETGAMPGALDMGEVMAQLRLKIAPDAIITIDGGNFSGWCQRFYRYTRFRSQLGPACGTMGYGVPAAIAAKSVEPDRPVVAFVGDGGMMMTGQEIATALHHGIAPVVLVINNGMYGTIRTVQEMRYPGRVIATDLSNPDFAAYARAFGAHGEVVERTADFAPAFDRALAAGRVAVLDLRIDPEAISTESTLSAYRGLASATTSGPRTG